MVKMTKQNSDRLSREELEKVLTNFDFDICIHIPASKLKELGFLMGHLTEIDDNKANMIL